MTILLQTIVSGIVAGGVYGLLGLGLSITYKTTGIVNFAHGTIALFGGYIAYALYHAHTPLALAALGGVVGAGGASVLMERLVLLPLYGKSLMSAILATFGVATVLTSITQLIWGSISLSLPSLASTNAWQLGIALSPEDLSTLLVAIAISAGLVLATERSRVGRALRACAQDGEMTSLLGIPTRRLYLISFSVAGLTAGVAGVLISPEIGLAPSNGMLLTVPAFAAAVLGGLGSLPGAMVGGILIGIVNNLTAVYISSSYADVVGYIAIGMVLLVRVRGLFGDELESVRSV
jgi:branched-chain amino acid transport system permease protein